MIPPSTNSQAGDSSGPSNGHDLGAVIDVHRPVPPSDRGTAPSPQSYPASRLMKPNAV